MGICSRSYRSIAAYTVFKGQDRQVDSYSGFYDNGKRAPAVVRSRFSFLGRSTGLRQFLRQQAENAQADAIQVDIVGLALGYCVSYTALDAKEESYHGRKLIVRVIEDATKSIILAAGDREKQISNLKAHGIDIVSSEAVIGALTNKV